MQTRQCKLARAALGWDATDLARACGIDERNIARFEGGGSVLPRQIEAMRAALEAKGIEFFDEGYACGAVRVRENDRCLAPQYSSRLVVI